MGSHTAQGDEAGDEDWPRTINNKGRTSRFTKLLLRRSKVERQKEEKETSK
jgi:hypothetical protein